MTLDHTISDGESLAPVFQSHLGEPELPSTNLQSYRPIKLARAWVYALRLDLAAAAKTARAIQLVTAEDPISGKHHLGRELLWSFIHFMADDGARALAHAQSARSLAREASEIGFVNTLMRCVLWRVGDRAGFLSVPRPIFSATRGRREQAIAMLARSVEAAFQLEQLHLHTAGGLLGLCHCSVSNHELVSGPGLFAGVLSAELLYEKGQLVEAERKLRQLIPMLRTGGAPEIALRAFRILARISCALGKTQFALSILTEGEELAHRRGWHRLLAACLAEKTHIFSSCDCLEEAQAQFARLNALVDSVASTVFDLRAEITGYRDCAGVSIALLTGATSKAAATLQRLIDDAAARGDFKSGFTLGVRQVHVLLSTQEVDSARHLLERLLVIAWNSGLLQAVFDGGAQLKALLEATTPNTERPAHVEAYTLMLLESWPEPISPQNPNRTTHRTQGLLTSREGKVLHLISLGHSNKAIAKQLGIAPETVKSHAKRIFARLGASTRAEATARGASLGLV